MSHTNLAPDGPGFSTTDLQELQRQLGAWRQRRRGRARLPEELWQAAGTLARQHGVSWVARALRLDFYQLRRRAEPAAPPSPPPGSTPQWVELQLEPLSPRGPREVRIELADGRGARMTLELGHDVPAMVAVAEVFWNRRP